VEKYRPVLHPVTVMTAKPEPKRGYRGELTSALTKKLPIEVGILVLGLIIPKAEDLINVFYYIRNFGRDGRDFETDVEHARFHIWLVPFAAGGKIQIWFIGNFRGELQEEIDDPAVRDGIGTYDHDPLGCDIHQVPFLQAGDSIKKPNKNKSGWLVGFESFPY